MEIFGVVYLLWNMLNGMKYFGQTTCTVEKRFREHARCKKSLIGRAIRKYGKENFRYGVIKTCASKAEMDAWETFFIAALKTKKPFGYNMTDGGGGTVGWKASPETCARMSASRTGKKRRPFTIEHRDKLSIASIDKCRSKSPYQNLLNELNSRQLSYPALAKLMGIAKPTVSDKIRGKYNFNARDKAKLVEIFGLPIEYLLQRDD